MEWVVPAYTGRYDAQWFIDDGVGLVGHEQIGWSSGRHQSPLAMFDCPLQLLNGDEDLSEAGINLGLAAIEATCSDYFFLMIEDITQESLEHSASFGERGFGPSQLR